MNAQSPRFTPTSCALANVKAIRSVIKYDAMARHYTRLAGKYALMAKSPIRGRRKSSVCVFIGISFGGYLLILLRRMTAEHARASSHGGNHQCSPRHRRHIGATAWARSQATIWRRRLMEYRRLSLDFVSSFAFHGRRRVFTSPLLEAAS